MALISLSWLPVIRPTSASGPAALAVARDSASVNNSEESMAGKDSRLFDQLSLDDKGLSVKAFATACKGYRKLEAKGLIRSHFLTICDFSQSANRKRMYLIDMLKEKIVMITYVAHGRNSGDEYATKFSNRNESLQSSLGFYVTSSTYIGGHGLSLRIAGMENGINDNALARSIVVHGASYLGDKWLNNAPFSGRSWGCPAVPAAQSAEIINTIKDGSCLFIYHPSSDYLKKSKLLNS